MTALYHFLNLVVPIAKKLHSLRTRGKSLSTYANWQKASLPASRWLVPFYISSIGSLPETLIMWNTWYMQDILDELQNNGQEARREDVERIAPLRFQHINVHGTYHFVLPESVAQGHHRPLRPLTSSSEELF